MTALPRLVPPLAALLFGACAAAASAAEQATPAAMATAAAASAPQGEPVGQAATPGAAPTAAAGSASAPAGGPRVVPAIESARRRARAAAEWIASSVDSWFGDKPFHEGGAVHDGRLYLSVLKRQDEDLDLRLRFNARFKLPNVEETTYLFFGRDNPRELVEDRPRELTSQQQLQAETAADRAFFAGIGRALNDEIDARIGFRGGLKPYAQVRYRRLWALGPDDLMEFRETVFWSVDDRFGSTTSFYYDHDFSPTVTSRWLAAATITRATRDWEWHTNLSVFKSFGNQRLATLELLANGTESIGVRVPDYGVQARWEQPVYRDWLVGEVVVGRFWPRRDALQPRDSVMAIGAGVKMRF